MWAGKKAAGKKNKFEMEKGLVFNKSFDLVLSLKNFNFCNLAGSIAYNGKGLCEVRATANRKSGGEPISSKNFFHFLKLRKN